VKPKTFSDKSIAVLPFVNMSADADQEYFSDGITEEILNALAQIKTLKVTSRTSSFYFKGKNVPLKDIAEQLKVAIILEGSVRIAGGKVRIKAQLIDAGEDFHFWSETWDRDLENIFEIQDEISLQIADKLREYVGHMEFEEHLVEKQTQNLDAYALYLKGLFHFNKWNPEDVIRSIEYFEQAIALDPNHTESLVGLADAYSFMGTTESYPREEAYMKTVEFTQRAFTLNPDNAGVHYQLANLSFFTDSSYDDALKHIDYALQLKPNFPEALQFKSFLQMLIGEMNKAHRYLQLALGVDPLNPETRFYKAYYLYRSKDYPKAEIVVDELLKQNPKNIPAIIFKGVLQFETGEIR
jgi:adenylate cyclase